MGHARRLGDRFGVVGVNAKHVARLVLAEQPAAIGGSSQVGADVAVPWLLVHGTEDDVVPLEDSRDIVAGAPHASLLELPGAGHVFSDTATTPMIDSVVPWVRDQMGA